MSRRAVAWDLTVAWGLRIFVAWQGGGTEAVEIDVNESAPRRPNRFLADLAQAMGSIAEAGRQAVIEQCRADAKAYVEALRTQTAEEAGAMRQAAEADLATIRERSEAHVERVNAETEQRIAQRHELLEQQLAEYHASIDQEVERVQERVTAFQNDVARFFDRLLEGADPTAFADMASQVPSPPIFDPDSQPPAKVSEEPGAEVAGASAAEIAAARPPLRPGTLTGAGAVRGRYYPEWYVEVDRLRAIGDENAAVTLLLDIVVGTEEESYADGVAVAPKPYEDLALIYRGRGDAEAEISILERFSRQSHAPGGVSARLLERLASLKGPARR